MKDDASKEVIYEFLDRFHQKGLSYALTTILPTPDISYDALLSGEIAFPTLVNYTDAVVFGSSLDIHFAGRLLRDLLQQDKRLSTKCQDLIAYLNNELKLLTAEPSSASKLTESKLSLSQGWNDFQKAKPEFAALCTQTALHFTPLWIPFRYLLPLPKITFDPEKIPLIFPEPLDCDFSAILSPLEDRPAIFVFETYKSLLSMLQFPAFVATLSNPKHLLYILEIYPNDQLAIQNRTFFQNSNFQPVFFTPRKHIQAALPALTAAIAECLMQADESLKSDSEPGNWLYQTAKRLLHSIRENRFGISRAAALLELTTHQNWHDPHKGMPNKDRDLGPTPKDNMALKLSLLARMPPRPVQPTKKIKVVHVVPQIIDGGHAPSLLLENLIVNHDKERFDVFLVSTERMQFHLYDYPYNFFISHSSELRAPKRLELIKSIGVPTEIQNGSPFYEFSALSTANFLQQIKADIVVFHGPDAVNYMAAALTDVPLRVLFEHGTPPDYSGFDLAIVSSLEAPEIYKEHYAKLKTAVRALPFQLDVRSQWEPAPYPKEKWGLPKDSKVMTTISNHLGNRLGNEMCMAIAEILQRIPEAYYVPMGNIKAEHKERLQKFFSGYNVQDRVIFLGGVVNPSQYARSMDLYLNEFPFGSGLGILDAMAADCPVVSMYDENGPQQGRYGGHYFGIDKAISSGKRGDYVDLACELLSNSEMHKEWSEHSVRQYEKQADVVAYVKKFETILSDYQFDEKDC